MAATVLPSDYDGSAVLYVDPVKLQHSGRVVGQSPDGDWYYIQSDNPNIDSQQWHFRVSARMLPQIIVTQ